MIHLMQKTDTPTELYNLHQEMIDLQDQIVIQGEVLFHEWEPLIERGTFIPAARNFAHYLALRKRDLRTLQSRLTARGLSSLGRSESRVLPSFEAVITTLSGLLADPADEHDYPDYDEFTYGQRLLEMHTAELFGPPADAHPVRIMVTQPNTVAEDVELLKRMLEAGMNVARINCAHDDPATWLAMIENLKTATDETGRECRILMDLGGPKIRISEIHKSSKGRVHIGDKIVLTASIELDSAVQIQIAVSHPELISHLAVGDKVWFDDGKLGLVVTDLTLYGAELEVTKASPKGVKLKLEKGVNFPDSELPIRSLTEKDLVDLDFVVQHADMVGYSFVQTPADIDLLIEEIRMRTDREIGIIAKIETPLAVKNLPELIVHAAGRLPFGVMIARGDLALELGFERLAEMQEEILWLSEAAAIPVIWATQVLENLAKTGVPSRAEMTDAAMSERAECVMLNKGPFITDAIETLDNIFTRMGRHQEKKTAQLTALTSW